jgi:hypothetical protein
MSINLQTQYKTSDGSTFEKKEDARQGTPDFPDC